jgi:hypothetical protein
MKPTIETANRRAAVRLLMALLFASACPAFGQTTDLKSDESIVFHPALAWQVDNGKTWEIEIRGSIFESEQRGVALGLLSDALDLNNVKRTEAEAAVFRERARLFMVDHERGKKVVIRFNEKKFTLKRSRDDGGFSGVIRLSNNEVMNLRTGTRHRMTLQFNAVLNAGDRRMFSGQAHLFQPTGLTVVSDIDDTIKVTNVRDREAMLRNTFLKPFDAAPGMAALFAHWKKTNAAQFCYVSASPWQLFGPLSDFMNTNGFPAGTIHLKEFRWKDESFFNLFSNPEAYKTATIGSLLKKFPQRQFVLVGDSGERDPEAYAALARKYPQQVRYIFIRDVTGESAEADRYRRVFGGLSRARWKIFPEALEIRDTLNH